MLRQEVRLLLAGGLDDFIAFHFIANSYYYLLIKTIQ